MYDTLTFDFSIRTRKLNGGTFDEDENGEIAFLIARHARAFISVLRSKCPDLDFEES